MTCLHALVTACIVGQLAGVRWFATVSPSGWTNVSEEDGE
jgi:hypothetical protein